MVHVENVLLRKQRHVHNPPCKVWVNWFRGGRNAGNGIKFRRYQVRERKRVGSTVRKVRPTLVSVGVVLVVYRWETVSSGQGVQAGSVGAGCNVRGRSLRASPVSRVPVNCGSRYNVRPYQPHCRRSRQPEQEQVTQPAVHSEGTTRSYVFPVWRCAYVGSEETRFERSVRV